MIVGCDDKSRKKGNNFFYKSGFAAVTGWKLQRTNFVKLAGLFKLLN